MKELLLILILFNTSIAAFSQRSDSLTQEEKEEKLLDFTNIKSVLKNDGLEKQREIKKKLVKQIKIERKLIQSGKYRYPSEHDFWKMMTELWLVKNAQALQWDFPKPQYGIAEALRGLMEKLGYYNKEIKVVIINTPNVAHMALPGGKNEYIFLLSLPFMRTLDLTKVDLSILLFEDFLRVKKGQFKDRINVDKKLLGKSFSDGNFNKSLVGDTLKEYSTLVFKKGFNFQQQYEVTKEMSQTLKAFPAIWGAYYRVLTKINRLIKNDLLYKDYLKVYPSPELQIQWLKPKKEIL